MVAHHREARVDNAALALLDLVDRRLHVVVDATARYPSQCSERAGVGIEQHLVALARVGHQPERPRSAQLQVRHLHAVVDATHHQPFFAPVKLERIAQLELQRHEGGGRHGLPLALPPSPDEVGQAAIAAVIALRLDQRQQRSRATPLMPRSVCVSLQRLRDRLDKRRELARHTLPPVLRLRLGRRLQPLLDRVA